MEQKNGMLVGIFSLVICVIIVMGVMTPIVSDWTTGERMENEGAGWLRMSYESSPSYQSIAADLSGDGVAIYNDRGTNGTETLSGTEDTIIYADDNLALWYENDTLFLLGQIDGEPVFVQRNDAISLIRESDGIRVSAAETPDIRFPFPTYAYEPNSDGKYAFFTNGTPVEMESGRPNAIVGGGFVGVYAYNDIYRYNGLGLYMHAVYDDDGQLYDAYWDKTTPIVESQSLNPDTLDPSAINLDPMNIDLDPITLTPSAQLMAVPTPTYTDGDWGYDLTTVGGVQKAVIVSYSGAGGDVITVPATVGGYTVHTVGKGTNNQVFNSSLSATGLVFSEGISVINKEAVYNCKYITGSLVIPSTVTSIGSNSFYNCIGFTELVLSEGLVTIEQRAFNGCTGFTGSLVIPSTVTSIGANAFSSNSGWNGALKILGECSVGNQAFSYCSNFTSIEAPNITSAGSQAFYFCSKVTNIIVVPASLTAIGSSSFGGLKSPGVVIASDAVPSGNAFSDNSYLTEVLDLSDTVDYSVNRYGIPANATVSDSIGDCFGYISFTEIGSDPAITGPIATLLIAVPLLMVVGLTIAAMTVMRGRVQ